MKDNCMIVVFNNVKEDLFLKENLITASYEDENYFTEQYYMNKYFDFRFFKYETFDKSDEECFVYAINEFRKKYGLLDNGNPTLNREEIEMLIDNISQRYFSVLSQAISIIKNCQTDMNYDNINKLQSIQNVISTRDLFCITDYEVVEEFEFCIDLKKELENPDFNGISISKIYTIE